MSKVASVTDNGDEITGENDVVIYTITVSNDGNVNLTDVTLEDVLTDNNNNPLNLSGPVLTSVTAGSSTATLQVNGVLTFTASYTIDQSAANSGRIINTASATASSPGNTGDVTDISDDPNTIADNDPTIIDTQSDASLEVTEVDPALADTKVGVVVKLSVLPAPSVKVSVMLMLLRVPMPVFSIIMV